MLGTCSAMEPHALTSMAWIPALQIRKLRLKEMKRPPINHRAGEGQTWDSGSSGNNGSQLGCLLLGELSTGSTIVQLPQLEGYGGVVLATTKSKPRMLVTSYNAKGSPSHRTMWDTESSS